MQKARSHPKAPAACKCMVSGSISLPCSGYFSPFPHGTSPLSVIEEYLGLTGGPARFTPNFRGSVLLGVTQKSHELTYTGVSPSVPRLSSRFNFTHGL